MNDNTQKVEVFQPRDPGQFYDCENDEATDEMFHELRDLRGGFVDVEAIDFERFGRCYNLVGTENVEVEDDTAGEDEKNALNAVFQTWQNNDGLTPTSDVFRQSNDDGRAVSLSTGDIVRVNGTAYLCESIGWSEVKEVSN